MSDMDRAEISDVLNNPYVGWAPWADGGPYPQPHSLVFAQIPWSMLEPTKNSFNWSQIESNFKFSYWASRNIKIILRISMDIPGSSSHKDIPDWLYSEINQEGTWYNRGFSPNYKNSALISNHRRMITALAKRYDDDPKIAFVEIGSLGHWGENHTVYLKSTDVGYFPPISISDQYVTHYVNNFINKKLLMRRPFQIAKDNHIGLYNDMFGNVTETPRFIRYFNEGYTNPGDYGFAAGVYPAMPDFWKYSPSGGEFGDCPGLQYLENSVIDRTIQYARDSYTSWLGPCCPASQAVGSSLQKNMDALHSTMGYRFVLESLVYPNAVNAGSAFSITMVWNNKGVAPFYYKWPLELSLADGTGNLIVKTETSADITGWLPGTTPVTYSLSVPENTAAGTYTLCAAILDPATGDPGVSFAMTGKRADGRYEIGSVRIIADDLPVITVDGNSSDWNSISAAVKQEIITTLKVTNNSTKLYLCVEGTDLNVKSQFYINTDSNTSTGYRVPGWDTTGCEYLIENNYLYRYTGNGSTWSWSRAETIEFSRNNNVIEAAAALASMGLSSNRTIRLGYICNDSATMRLPDAGNDLVSYTLI